jgi:hypothetical protein
MRNGAARLPDPPLLLPDDAPLSALRNVGKAMVADFAVLGISTVGELRRRDADDLYGELCRRTRHRHDPCVNGVFAAAVHQATTGEALDWWAFTPARKQRQAHSATTKAGRPGR